MSNTRMFETAPDAGALSALRHNQIRTEITFLLRIRFPAVERG